MVSAEMTATAAALSVGLAGFDQLDVATQRAGYRQTAPPPDEDTRFEPASFGGIAGEAVWHGVVEDHVAGLYLHGGGYAIGEPAIWRQYCGRQSAASRIKFFVPDYRLAPEHPHPAALEDAIAAYDGLRSQGYEPEQIVIVGDSAGGGLALALAMTLRDRGDAPVAGIAVMSPWTDLTLASVAAAESVADAFVTWKQLDDYASWYTAGDVTLRRHPAVSPLFGDFGDIPPIHAEWGSAEMLHRDVQSMVESARAAGVAVDANPVEGATHIFQSIASETPEARASIVRIGQFLSDRLGIDERG